MVEGGEGCMEGARKEGRKVVRKEGGKVLRKKRRS
jgi:hypothetical protein